MKRKFHSEQFIGLESETDLFNHGLAWQRGPLLGKGGFSSVYLANLKKRKLNDGNLPDLMAIKSASVSLQKEKEVLHNLRNCPYIINCYGDETTTTHNGHMIYNLLLEYASGGTLSDLIKKSGGGCGLPESDVKRYTRCILKGIEYIHSHGYVHCDLKPDNVLLVPAKTGDSLVPKIGDFGLAKSRKMKQDRSIGGTALYMAPETVIDRVQEAPCDVWALGCIVFEMLTGKKVWDPKPGMTKDEIFDKIGDRCELPKIPPHISEEGKCFLKACLVRNPVFRFTAAMLLIHPFLSRSDTESLDAERPNSTCGEDEWSGSDDWSFVSESSSSDDSSCLGEGGVLNTKFRMLNPKLLELERGGAGVLKVV